MTINNILNKYGLETFEQAESDDIAEVDLYESLSELDSTGITATSDLASQEVKESLELYDEVERARVSVENYLMFLENRQAKGLSLTDDIANSIRIGLEHISPDLFTKTVVSVEDVIEGELVDDDDADTGYGAKETNEKDKAYNKTKKGLIEKIKQFFKAAAQMLKRIVNASMDFYHNALTSVTKLLSKIDETAKAASTLEGGKEMKVRGLSRLVIDGEFKGNDPEAYKEIGVISKLLLNDLTIQLQKEYVVLYEEITKFLSDPKNVDHLTKDDFEFGGRGFRFEMNVVTAKDKISDKFKGILKKGLDKVYRVGDVKGHFKTENDLKNVPKDIEEPPFSRVYLTRSRDGDEEQSEENGSIVPLKSKTLLGNRAFYVALPDRDMIDRTLGAFRYGLYMEPTKEQSLGLSSEQVVTMNARTAVSVLAELKRIIKEIPEYRKAANETKANVSKILRNNDKYVYDFYREGHNSIFKGEAMKFIASHLSMTQHQLRQMSETNWQFVGYLLGLAKATVTVINEMVKVEAKTTMDGETEPGAFDRSRALPAPSK